jgi:hypothetical protein
LVVGTTPRKLEQKASAVGIASRELTALFTSLPARTMLKKREAVRVEAKKRIVV